jgi:FtsZ-interacting cell division protein ZipA
MRISSLQLGLIIAGVVLVLGVVVYNAWVLRRARRARMPEVFAPAAPQARVEPSLHGPADAAGIEDANAQGASDPEPGESGENWTIPLADETRLPRAADALAEQGSAHRHDASPRPDPEIEAVVLFNLMAPVMSDALASGMQMRSSKPLRWFGRRDAGGEWQLLTPGSAGSWIECAACMRLADRNGAASYEAIDAFIRMTGTLAAALPAMTTPPLTADEAARAEALDRLCAELDMQIGITLQRAGGGTIPGTRLRGVAEASGFKLAADGRYEWLAEDGDSVLYTLHHQSGEPFSNEMLRVSEIKAVVFELDVPRVADPARVFDQMKLAAARMAKTLDGELIDDNRRPFAEESLARTRAEIAAAAEALTEVRIAPGSPRALQLFSH